MDEKVVVNVKNMEMTDRIKDYIDKKIPRLERLLPDIETLKFDLSFAKNARNRSDREVSQITITGKGFVYAPRNVIQTCCQRLTAPLIKCSVRLRDSKEKGLESR
jgi:ribosomal subunit interface protein